MTIYKMKINPYVMKKKEFVIVLMIMRTKMMTK
eukprot:CAMPEP_0171006540 /NCGR_PEP_ID=MMETSP0736-20130129/19121_1 /TAXON_ID=186038 /ORGANISM="Fragilariopsis kerguelensis, Strain L26-C5" /LENGTH=32 /DNA_ID= /DNA_START= /DNA_END= /DNA_ORIENTATION=